MADNEREFVITFRGRNLSDGETKAITEALAGVSRTADKATEATKKLPAEFDKATKSAKGLALDLDRVNALFKQYGGHDAKQRAEEIAAAVQKAGGAAKLTAAELREVNTALQAGIDKGRVLGETAPKHIRDMAAETKRLLEQMTKVPQQLEDSAAKTSIFDASWRRLTGAFTAAALIERGITSIVGGIGEMASQSTKLNGLSNSFENLSNTVQQDSREMLAAMRGGTRGLVTDIELFQAANKAMLLGLPVSTTSLREMTSAATALSRAMGTDATKALDDFITALGRSSPQILDNLGLTVRLDEANQKFARSVGKSVDSLTEQERKLAFYNEALEKAREKAQAVGEDHLTMSEMLGQAWTAIQNDGTSFFSWLNKELGRGSQMILEDLAYLGSLGSVAKAGGAPKSMPEKEAEREWAKAWATSPKLKSLFAPELAGLPNSLAAADKELTKIERTREAHWDRLQERIDKLTGADVRRNVESLAEAVRSISPSAMSAAGLSWLQDQVVQLAAMGAKLPPELQKYFPKPALTPLVLPKGLTPIDFFDPRRSASLSAAGFTGMNLLGSVSRNELAQTPLSPVNFFDPHRSSSLEAAGFVGLNLLSGRPSTTQGPSLGSLARAGFSSSLDRLPDTILQSVMGGGDVTRAVSTMLASQLGSSLMGSVKDGVFKDGVGKMLQESFLGKAGGGMIASLIPGGLGLVAGPLMNALVGGVSRLAGVNATKKGREGLAEDLGFNNLGGLYSDLESLGEEGKKLAHVGRNIVGRNDEAANKRWMAEVEAFYGRIAGGADKNKRLIAEQNEAQQFLNDTLAKYGFLTEEMGPKVRAQRLNEQAELLAREWTAVTAAQVDSEAIARRMGPELSKFYQELKKGNGEADISMKPMLESAIRFGTLVDENGNKIESLEGIRFAETFSQGVDRMISKLDELIRKLTGGVGAAIEDVGDGMAGLTGEAADVGPRSWLKGPTFAMANGGIINGGGSGAWAYIEPGRKELIGDEHMLERAMMRGLARLQGGAGGGSASISIGAIYINGEAARNPASLKRTIRDELAPALAAEIRKSGTLKTLFLEAQGLSVAPTGLGI